MSKRKTNDPQTKEIIKQLKRVREEKGLSYSEIMDLVEKNGDYISKTTLSKVFGEGSESLNYDYEYTIRPVAKALLDIETIEADDDIDIQAMKTLLKYKMEKIQDLEHQIEQLQAAVDKEKLHAREKFDAERKLYNDRIIFLTNQVELKDKRMDQLLEAVFQKDIQNKQLMEKFFNCHCCDKR